MLGTLCQSSHSDERTPARTFERREAAYEICSGGSLARNILIPIKVQEIHHRLALPLYDDPILSDSCGQRVLTQGLSDVFSLFRNLIFQIVVDCHSKIFLADPPALSLLDSLEVAERSFSCSEFSRARTGEERTSQLPAGDKDGSFVSVLPLSTKERWRGSKSLAYISERRRSVDRRTAGPVKLSVFLTVTVLPREPLFIFHGVAYTARPARTHDFLFKACPGLSMVCKLRL